MKNAQFVANHSLKEKTKKAKHSLHVVDSQHVNTSNLKWQKMRIKQLKNYVLNVVLHYLRKKVNMDTSMDVAIILTANTWKKSKELNESKISFFLLLMLKYLYE